MVIKELARSRHLSEVYQIATDKYRLRMYEMVGQPAILLTKQPIEKDKTGSDYSEFARIENQNSDWVLIKF